MHEVLVNCLGGLSLPRKSVVRLTDRPDMTLDVYRGRKTTMQQQQQQPPLLVLSMHMAYMNERKHSMIQQSSCNMNLVLMVAKKSVEEIKAIKVGLIIKDIPKLANGQL